MKKIITMFIISILCMFALCINVKGVGKSGTGCSLNQLNNLAKDITINKNDKLCVYKNADNYDEYYPVQFKYSTEYGVYTLSNIKSCSNMQLMDNRDSQSNSSCDKYHLIYDYNAFAEKTIMV